MFISWVKNHRYFLVDLSTNFFLVNLAAVRGGFNPVEKRNVELNVEMYHFPMPW